MKDDKVWANLVLNVKININKEHINIQYFGFGYIPYTHYTYRYLYIFIYTYYIKEKYCQAVSIFSFHLLLNMMSFYVLCVSLVLCAVLTI